MCKDCLCCVCFGVKFEEKKKISDVDHFEPIGQKVGKHSDLQRETQKSVTRSSVY